MANQHDHLVALFDTEDHANAAVKNLNTAGYNDVSLVTANSHGDPSVVKEPGFWKKLFGKAVEEYEAKVYAHNVGEKGGAVVAANPVTWLKPVACSQLTTLLTSRSASLTMPS